MDLRPKRPAWSSADPAEPKFHDFVDLKHLFWTQITQPSQEPSLADRPEILHVECTLLQAACPQGNLKPCPTQRGGVRNDSVECSLILQKRHAVNQSGADLGHE